MERDLQQVEHEVARILAETDQPVEPYAATLSAIGTGLGWELGSVWETNPESGRLHCVRTWHSGGDATEFEAMSERLEFEPGGGLPGPGLSSREPTSPLDAPPAVNL